MVVDAGEDAGEEAGEDAGEEAGEAQEKGVVEEVEGDEVVVVVEEEGQEEGEEGTEVEEEIERTGKIEIKINNNNNNNNKKMTRGGNGNRIMLPTPPTRIVDLGRRIATEVVEVEVEEGMPLRPTMRATRGIGTIPRVSVNGRRPRNSRRTNGKSRSD